MREESVLPMSFLADLTICCSLFSLLQVAEPNQTVIEVVMQEVHSLLGLLGKTGSVQVLRESSLHSMCDYHGHVSPVLRKEETTC